MTITDYIKRIDYNMYEILIEKINYLYDDKNDQLISKYNRIEDTLDGFRWYISWDKK